MTKERITVTIDKDLISMIKSYTNNLSNRLEQLLRLGLLAEDKSKSNITLKQAILLLVSVHDKNYPNNAIIKKG